MTAQVAVLNRMGVALAADSAVTVGRRKVFNTANKLFTLSKYHPVGIMVYGNAEFMGVPYETVVKTFRGRIGDREFPTVERYVGEFVRYISLPKFKSADADAKNSISVAVAIYSALKSRLEDRAQELGVEFEGLPAKEVQQVLATRMAALRSKKAANGFASITAANLLRRYRDEIRSARESCCEDWPTW